MRDDGGGALSAITVSSRELVVRGAAGAGHCHGRAAAQLQRAGLLAHELLGLLHLAPGAARVQRRWAHGPLLPLCGYWSKLEKISRRAAARPSGHVSGFTAMADHAQQQQTQKT